MVVYNLVCDYISEFHCSVEVFTYENYEDAVAQAKRWIEEEKENYDYDKEEYDIYEYEETNVGDSFYTVFEWSVHKKGRYMEWHTNITIRKCEVVQRKGEELQMNSYEILT